MKRLHLLRHAKSSWDDPGLPDHDRPLAPRGRRAAARLAGWLEDNEVRPQLVLCSTAVRARATLALVTASLNEPVSLFEGALYHAAAAGLLERVRGIDDDVEEALLVGHNPGLQDLCVLLAAASPERDRVAAKLPAAALVSLELDVESWADAATGCARIAVVARPREL
jgi:phosphohistidine phosphatase